MYVVVGVIGVDLDTTNRVDAVTVVTVKGDQSRTPLARFSIRGNQQVDYRAGHVADGDAQCQSAVITGIDLVENLRSRRDPLWHQPVNRARVWRNSCCQAISSSASAHAADGHGGSENAESASV
jgi:hypothetical protein